MFLMAEFECYLNFYFESYKSNFLIATLNFFIRSIFIIFKIRKLIIIIFKLTHFDTQKMIEFSLSISN